MCSASAVMMGHVYGALLVALQVVRLVPAESVRWLAGCMGFVWACCFVDPQCGFSLSLFCNYM